MNYKQIFKCVALIVFSALFIATLSYAVVTLPMQQGGTTTSTATVGGIWYWDGTSFTQDYTNLFWDGGNSRLGLATTTPSDLLSMGSILSSQRLVNTLGGYTSQASSTYTSTTDFTAAVTGISLDEIENLAASKTFTMANNNLTYNFTTPSDGLTLNSTGAFSDHILHLHQQSGNPGAGTQMLHIQTADSDVLPLFIESAATISAIINGEVHASSTITTSATTTQFDITDGTNGFRFTPGPTSTIEAY